MHKLNSLSKLWHIIISVFARTAKAIDILSVLHYLQLKWFVDIITLIKCMLCTGHWLLVQPKKNTNCYILNMAFMYYFNLWYIYIGYHFDWWQTSKMLGGMECDQNYLISGTLISEPVTITCLQHAVQRP